MSVVRRFLGWDRFLTESVCEYILPGGTPGTVDLGALLIVTPTQQAGRRLRECLAARCGAGDGAALSVHVVPPSYFLVTGGESPVVECSAAVSQAVWAHTLRAVPPDAFPIALKVPEGGCDAAWALRTGRQFQSLRAVLADGGVTIADVVARLGEALPERERWVELAALEQRYREQAHAFGVADPCDVKMRRAERPVLPEGVSRVVVAGVPDPSLLTLRALERLADTVSVEVLIHAPESLESLFDGWGRPLPDAWRTREIPLPDGADGILLAGTPEAQAACVIDTIEAVDARWGAGDLAIGVPDVEVIPHVMAALSDQGLRAFDPGDRPMSRHRLFHLIAAVVALHRDGSYEALRAALRHPDLLGRVASTGGVAGDAVLTELDRLQNDHLPPDVSAVRAVLARKPPDRATALGAALAALDALIAPLGVASVHDAVAALLRDVYAGRMLDANDGTDQDFLRAAGCVMDVLDEFRAAAMESLDLSEADRLQLFVSRLGESSYPCDRDAAQVDLEGWLELPWNNAAVLIVTGMNEGCVPDGRLSDVFLPDALRVRLGLRHDALRLARDVYLLSAMCACRRRDGVVRLICGKVSGAGDPLRPSRLLFRCPEADLPGRAARLFDAPREERLTCPATVSFRLRPAAAGVKAEERTIERLPVTAFHDYLACPFRFYLTHLLDMASLSDDKRELDARDFGSLVHHVLEQLADPELYALSDAGLLGDALEGAARAWVRRRYGARPALPVLVALDAAVQRLHAAAQCHVALPTVGWEPLRVEQKATLQVGGLTVSGRIDRVDRHRDRGTLRVIDYKTSDRAVHPAESHLSTARADTPSFALAGIQVRGRNLCWTDLQLPLYRAMVTAMGLGGDIELAYFNLPKAIVDTGMAVWDEMNEALHETAMACARGVALAIAERRFWPPVERVSYDVCDPLVAGVPVADAVEPLS